MLKGLTAPNGALVIMDAGIATAANIAWLKKQEYRYLVVSRERGRQFDPDQAVETLTASNETIQTAARAEQRRHGSPACIAIPPGATPRRPRSPDAS